MIMRMVIRIISWNLILLVTMTFLGGCSQLPSMTIDPVQTQTITPTFVPSITSTKTPYSTLGIDEAKNRVAYLLETNDHCDYPCWWGLTPGKASWAEARVYFASFAKDIYLSDYQPFDLSLYWIEFPDPYSENTLYVEVFIDESGMIRIVVTNLYDTLPSILEKVGAPSEIWVNIAPSIGSAPMEFTLALYYEEGIMLSFVGSTDVDSDHMIRICPSQLQEAWSQIWLWDNTRFHSFVDIGNYGVIPPRTPENLFRSLDDVSDSQPQLFFDHFVDPSSTYCIETPITDWFK